MVNPDSLTNFEKDLLIITLMYFLPIDMRHKLMAILPAIYNKVVGLDVMSVKQVSATPSWRLRPWYDEVKVSRT